MYGLVDNISFLYCELFQANIDDVEANINKVKANIEANRDEVKAHIDTNIDEVEANINEVKTNIETNINEIETNITAKIDNIVSEIYNFQVNYFYIDIIGDSKGTFVKYIK